MNFGNSLFKCRKLYLWTSSRSMKNLTPEESNYSNPVKKAFPSGPRAVSKPFIHPQTIKRHLNANPETVLKILEIDVNENLSSDEQIRVGSRGSLCINRETTKGCPKGVWFNFETDESGDMFQLVKIKKNLSDQEMIAFAAEQILPYIDKTDVKTGDVSKENKQISENSGVKNRHDGIQNYLHQITSELLPIDGTIAEDYLKDHRKIQMTEKNPDTLKFHPNLNTRSSTGEFLHNIPGLVVLASHPQSKKNNIQMTYLDPTTGKKHPGVALSRRIIGSFSDPAGYHYCEISKTLGRDFTFVAEGVETALSIYEAFQSDHVIATLGKHNFARIDPNVMNDKVVLVFDNDGNNVWEDKILLKATKRLMIEGKHVFIVFPPAIEGLEKTDMNDFMIALGVNGVYEVITNNLKKVHL